MEPAQQLKIAYDEAKAGNLAQARQLVEELLRQDLNNEAAWHLYAHIAASKADAIEALERVLALNPQNNQAKRELQKLSGSPDQQNQSQRLTVSTAASAEHPKQRANSKSFLSDPVILITGGLIGLVVVGFLVYLVITNLPVASAAILQPPTPVPTTQQISPTVPSTPPTNCSCKEATDYLNRTLARFTQVYSDIDYIQSAMNAGTLQFFDLSVVNGRAKALYQDQISETPPPCLQSFQSKSVSLFWDWQQSMEYMAKGQVNSASVFAQQFIQEVISLENEGSKLQDKLQACPSNGQMPTF